MRRYSLASFALAAVAGTFALVHSAPATAAGASDLPAAHVVTALPVSLPVVTARRALPTARVTAPKPVKATARPHRRAAVAVPDGYPYAHAQTNADDAWGFTERQCVSYAAWRLAQSGHAISESDGWGSAYQWDDAARRLGFGISTTPVVGSIAQWNVGESSAVFVGDVSSPDARFTAGEYGHVGYVTAVYPDGSALVAQYNLRGDRAFSVMRMRAPRFLLLGR